MDSNQEKSIFDNFLYDPAMVYREIHKMNQANRREVMALEEMLITHRWGGHIEAAGLDDAIVEGVAEVVDSLLENEEVEGMEQYPSNMISGVIDSIKKMEDEERKPIPPDLRIILARHMLEPEYSLPALVIRLTQFGLQAVKSSLQGFMELPEAAVAVRSGSTGVLEKQERLEFVQKIGDAPTERFTLKYEVIRESQDSVTLSLTIPPQPADYRVDLRQNGRLMDARNEAPNNLVRVSFDHLLPGHYEIILQGALIGRFPVVIADSTEGT